MLSKMSKIVIVSIGFFLLILIGIGILGCMRKQKESLDTSLKKEKDYQIIVYKRGIPLVGRSKKTILDPALPGAIKLKTVIEEILITADDMLREAVFEDTIQKIKNHESAVEIIYENSREFQISAYQRSIKIDRILIPLSGYYSSRTTIFYGNKGYSSGPYVNSKKNIQRIKELIP